MSYFQTAIDSILVIWVLALTACQVRAGRTIRRLRRTVEQLEREVSILESAVLGDGRQDGFQDGSMTVLKTVLPVKTRVLACADGLAEARVVDEAPAGHDAVLDFTRSVSRRRKGHEVSAADMRERLRTGWSR